jgi:hypothetical protein
MLYYLGKLALTSVLVVLVSELSKRSSLLGALLASVPLVSVLAMIWLYVDTGDVEQIADLAGSIFWLVLPSLVLFIALPLLLRGGLGFWPSLAISIAATMLLYGLLILLLRRLGVSL